MARPVGDAVHGGGAARSTEARDNYGQQRSEIAHATNALRKAQRTGDDAGVLAATLRLAQSLKVDLGATEGKTGAELLKLLGEKVNVAPENLSVDTLANPQRSVTDHGQLMDLIGGLK